MSKSHDKLATVKLTHENRSRVEARVRLYAKSGLKVSFNSAANMALHEGLSSTNIPNPEWFGASHDILLPKQAAVVKIRRKK